MDSTARVLEDFESIQRSKREYAFRPKRFLNQRANLTIKINDITCKLLDWSHTGLSFSISSGSFKWKVGDLIDEVKVTLDNFLLYDGKIKVSNVTTAGNELRIGVSLKSKLMSVEGIDSVTQTIDFMQGIEGTLEEIGKADFHACNIIIQTSFMLQQLKNFCNQQDKLLQELPYDRKNEAELILLHSLSERVNNIFMRLNQSMSKVLDVEHLPEKTIYHTLFDNLINPYFMGSPLPERAITKPRGYAGDYEMMNHFYRSEFEGNNFFQKILHYYTLSEMSGDAVRYRKDYFFGFYGHLLEKNGNQKVLAVACGPAIEYQKVVQTFSQEDLARLEVTLFDLDRDALEHAQSKVLQISLEQEKEPKVNFVNANVVTFLKDNRTSNMKYDLIYSGGLFDYLDNQTSQALTERFYKLLNPGGTLVIGNFTNNNPTAAFCTLLTQWHLIYKSEQEIRGWAKNLQQAKVEVDYDDLKINAFLRIQKNN